MVTTEILSIGTELLLGQILNTNAQFLSRELAELGLDCLWRSEVGDNRARIRECLTLALARAELVLITGGLGPTADDLTMECLAELFGVSMNFDADTMAHIESLFTARGIHMVESNRKQALRPQGSIMVPNPKGTAPGIFWRIDEALLKKAGIADLKGERIIVAFPGVPSEMTAMWKASVRPALQKLYSAGAIWSMELRHYGVGESSLAEKYAGLLSGANPTVAPLAGKGECLLRVTAKARTEIEAAALARPVIDKIKQESGTLCYGVDGDSLESVTAALLTRAAMRLSVAESCTGGLLSKRLTDIAGSSAYLNLGLITYTNRSKAELLGVPEHILAEKGAVSAECAQSMADGVRRLSGSDIGVAITGIAGPGGGTADKPVGLVYLAISTDSQSVSKTLELSCLQSRKEIRWASTSEALNMLRLYLLGLLPK